MTEKRLSWILLFFLIQVQMFSQEILENPETPQNPNAGRVLELKEEFRIIDDSGEFFFDFPRDLQVASDGSIFFRDKTQIIRLDEKGNFLHNFYEKGQGPGEVNVVRGLRLQEDKLVVFNTSPNKLIWFKFNGDLIKDIKIRDAPFGLRSVFHTNDSFIFFKSGFPNTGGEIEIMTRPQIITTIDHEGRFKGEFSVFPIKAYGIRTEEFGVSTPISTLIFIPYQNRYILISNSQEYLLKVYDVETDTTLVRFKRDYKRVKTPKDWRGGGFGINGTAHRPPRPEYLNDIVELYMFMDNLWVLTSTKDGKKGNLIDAFNINGEFIDSFYLKEGRIIGTHEDCIFVRIRTEEELYQIVKYKVVGYSQ